MNKGCGWAFPLDQNNPVNTLQALWELRAGPTDGTSVYKQGMLVGRGWGWEEGGSVGGGGASSFVVISTTELSDTLKPITPATVWAAVMRDSLWGCYEMYNRHYICKDTFLLSILFPCIVEQPLVPTCQCNTRRLAHWFIKAPMLTPGRR